MFLSRLSLRGHRKMNETVTVKQAAKELGIAECSVRIWIECGALPIGYCVKRRGGKRARYIIPRAKLDSYLGKNKGEEA
jgi:hypothetical protein